MSIRTLVLSILSLGYLGLPAPALAASGYTYLYVSGCGDGVQRDFGSRCVLIVSDVYWAKKSKFSDDYGRMSFRKWVEAELSESHDLDSPVYIFPSPSRQEAEDDLIDTVRDAKRRDDTRVIRTGWKWGG